jgi:[ribosomal protein S18]-alanine N-acetyltransferase
MPARDRIPVQIRWMISRDMPEVLGIETACYSAPWDEEDFRRALRQRNCIGMVAEISLHHQLAVIGYMVYFLQRGKINLVNLAVSPPFQRARVGSQMVQKLIGKLKSPRRERITIEVRETNLAAQLFFRSQGFLATEVVRRSFDDTGEDGFAIEYALPDAEPTEETEAVDPYYGGSYSGD